MWCVRNIEFRPVEMDFTSSGQGRHSSTAVYADGAEIINALDLVQFVDGPIQLQVCGHCGITRCASGGWVSPRRFGEGLLLIPCFREMEAEPRRGRSVGARGDVYEHDPPYGNEKNGPAFLTGAALERAGSRVPAFRELDRWPLLRASEFTRIMQAAAPARLLGEFPDPPQVRDELVVAVDPGEKDEGIS